MTLNHNSTLAPLALLVSIVALHGCATPSQMAADSEVRRLCAIDGGIKVYETVRLPADMFNQWGQVNFYKPTQGSNALGPSYTFKHEAQWLANTNDSSLHGIKMLREYYAVIRTSDGKMLGETVLYGRGGGDVPGPWHPSSFSCPPPVESDSEALFKQIFIRSM